MTGALNRASRTSRPRRPADIDWNRTIRANLRNYLPEQRTGVPERLIGYARKQQAWRVTSSSAWTSGSMASSVVYAGVFGAAPGYDHENAAALADLGVAAFACTPDAFGDLMAAAIERRDIASWAQRHQSAT